MGTLGRTLVMALVASAAGAVSGLSSGAVEGKRPIVQTIAASQPAGMKVIVFHRSTNVAAERQAMAAAPQLATPAETTAQVGPAQPLRAAPVARAALAVGSGLADDLVNPWRPNAGAVAAGKKPSERLRRGPSARFGQSEIVDPWSTKR